jgi:hypothetical protein
VSFRTAKVLFKTTSFVKRLSLPQFLTTTRQGGAIGQVSGDSLRFPHSTIRSERARLQSMRSRGVSGSVEMEELAYELPDEEPA